MELRPGSRVNLNPLRTRIPGVGKNHLAGVPGHRAINAGHFVLHVSTSDLVRTLPADTTAGGARCPLTRWLKPDLLVPDDFGITPPPQAGEWLPEIALRDTKPVHRHDVQRPLFKKWGRRLHDIPAVTAIIDRFHPRAEIIQTTGRSFRLKDAALRRSQNAGSAPAPNPGPLRLR